MKKQTLLYLMLMSILTGIAQETKPVTIETAEQILKTKKQTFFFIFHALKKLTVNFGAIL